MRTKFKCLWMESHLSSQRWFYKRITAPGPEMVPEQRMNWENTFLNEDIWAANFQNILSASPFSWQICTYNALQIF